MESSFLRNGRQRVPQRILVLQDRMNALRTGKSVCLKERAWGISSVGRFLAFAVKRQARPLVICPGAEMSLCTGMCSAHG